MTMLRTTVVALAVTLAGCSLRVESSPSSTTVPTVLAALPATTVDVAGAWRVVSAGKAAPFVPSDQLSFLDDGTFLFDGALTDGGGAWSLTAGVMRLEMRANSWSFLVTAEDRELHLVGPGSEMILRRG